MNKGRDYYRALQVYWKQRLKHRRYPAPVDVHQENIPGRQKAEFVALGDRYYRKDNVRNKIWTAPYAVGPDGTPVTIPYQTSTLVRVEPIPVSSE